MVSGKDIVCYKVVIFNKHSGRYNSEWKGFTYRTDETYTEDSIPLSKLDKAINLYGGVFHSYMASFFGLYEIERMQWSNSLWVNTMSLVHYMVLKCVIPAGTPYWKNSIFGEYASTSIKVIKAFEPDEFFDKVIVKGEK